MKLTKRGYRVSKNGKVNYGVEKWGIKKGSNLGHTIKVDGIYYYFERKQGDSFIYLP